jgi:hypothetical protein
VVAVEFAREICGTCPVTRDCVLDALDEEHGVWGGTSGRQRRRIREMRAKGMGFDEAWLAVSVDQRMVRSATTAEGVVVELRPRRAEIEDDDVKAFAADG